MTAGKGHGQRMLEDRREEAFGETRGEAERAIM